MQFQNLLDSEERDTRESTQSSEMSSQHLYRLGERLLDQLRDRLELSVDGIEKLELENCEERGVRDRSPLRGAGRGGRSKGVVSSSASTTSEDSAGRISDFLGNTTLQ